MSGGADGNLSDSSSAVSGLSLRDGNNQGQLVNHNLNLSTSSTSCDAHDPRTLEILRLRAEQQTLRAENCALKRQIRDMEQLLSNISQEMGRLAQERRTGVGNIAAGVLARSQLFISI